VDTVQNGRELCSFQWDIWLLFSKTSATDGTVEDMGISWVGIGEKVGNAGPGGMGLKISSTVGYMVAGIASVFMVNPPSEGIGVFECIPIEVAR
jgi:hypothetical protein